MQNRFLFDVFSFFSIRHDPSYTKEKLENKRISFSMMSEGENKGRTIGEQNIIHIHEIFRLSSFALFGVCSIFLLLFIFIF